MCYNVVNVVPLSVWGLSGYWFPPMVQKHAFRGGELVNLHCPSA